MPGLREKLLYVIGDQSVNSWADQHDIARQTVHEWIKNDRMPRDAALTHLALGTGIPKEWWISGTGEPPVRKSTQQQAHYDLGKAKDDDVVYVNRHLDVNGSAGPGSIVDNEWLIERVAFNAEALRQSIGVPAKYLKIANVDGYSMEPFMFHGDQVFIDTRCNTFKNDGVYAIIHDGDLRFKRVRVNYADNTVLLKSDNDGGMGPEVLNEEQANRLKILGKVIPFKFGHFKL